jgi:dihydrofolate reductase
MARNMKLVVAVDKNWAIGNKGELLARVRADLKNFSKVTTGHTVVLGSKTLATFPGGRVLKNRTNIVMTRNESFRPEGAVIANSVEDLLEKIKDLDSDEVYVIGGASVYEQLLPYCDTAIVTKFNNSYEYDAAIPNLDESDEWECISQGEWQKSDPATDSEADLEFCFTTYKRTKK